MFTLSLIILLSLFIFFSSFIPRLHEYSAITTLKKIFSLNKNYSTYSFLNGIRALSLFWIILGHSFVFQTIVSDNIIHILDNVYNSYIMQLLLGAVFGVDTFFFISGFLAVFVFLKTFKTQGKLILSFFLENKTKEWVGKFFILDDFHVRHLFMYYFHRYCRLIPTLVFVLLISINLTSWMGHGPIFPEENGFEGAVCHNQWWKTILFVNNLVSPDKACLPVTW